MKTTLVLLIWSTAAFAQSRSVAITVDDLPYAGDQTAASPQAVNAKLLAAFARHHVPVTGFVIEKRIAEIGVTQGTGILRDWVLQGFDLGNHLYSHPDTNDLSVQQIEDEIVKGEATFGSLMKQAGKPVRFLRFPFNHTGDTKAKHDAVAAFLANRGYKVATCTIDTSDYEFNNAYIRMLAKGDEASATKLKTEYLAYSAAEIDYYAGLNRRVVGYEPPEVMLLHDNLLNSELIDQVLGLFEDRGYRFVSLEAAQADQAYQTPETFVTKGGMMWGYRWAAERNVKYDGKLEPDPAAWILNYK